MTRNLKLPSVVAVVLAGGKGKRMQSRHPKVLHKLAGQPMIFYTLKNLEKLNLSEIFVVVGYRARLVQKTVSSLFNCKFVHQDIPKGTAHALRCTLDLLDPKIKTVLVVNGDDSAFYSLDTLLKFLRLHQKNKSKISLITLLISNNSPLGRVIRDQNGKFLQILEASKYFNSSFQSNEINCGAYIFEFQWLKENIDKVELNEVGEYYITDLLNIAKEDQIEVNLFNLPNNEEWVGVNTPEELKYADELMRRRIHDREI